MKGKVVHRPDGRYLSGLFSSTMYESHPTPAGAANVEKMSDGFTKLHPGAPVHVFTKAEDALFHDHPFNFISHVIAGSYVEEILLQNDDGTYRVETFHRKAGTSHDVQANTIHKIIELPDGFCVTRAEYGPKTQTPSFYDFRPDGLYNRFWNEQNWRLISAAELQKSGVTTSHTAE